MEAKLVEGNGFVRASVRKKHILRDMKAT